MTEHQLAESLFIIIDIVFLIWVTFFEKIIKIKWLTKVLILVNFFWFGLILLAQTFPPYSTPITATTANKTNNKLDIYHCYILNEYSSTPNERHSNFTYSLLPNQTKSETIEVDMVKELWTIGINPENRVVYFGSTTRFPITELKLKIANTNNIISNIEKEVLLEIKKCVRERIINTVLLIIHLILCLMVCSTLRIKINFRRLLVTKYPS